MCLHDDSRHYLRPVIQCHTLVELVWLLEASLDVMLDIYPVLHFVPPLFVLHYAKFSLERTYNILYILNQHIASVTEFFFLILMKYHSQNRHIYSVFEKVTYSSLYIHQMFINWNNVFWNTFWGIQAIFFWLANAHMKGLLSYNSMDMLILTHTYNFSDVN